MILGGLLYYNGVPGVEFPGFSVFVSFFFLSLFPYPVSDIIIYARGFTIFNSFFLIFRGNRRFIVC